MDKLYLRDPGHNPTSSELLLERCIAKESEPCPASRKLVQRSSKFGRIQCTIQKKLFLSEKGSRTSLSKETLFKPKSQNWSWDWYVVMIKMNEKLTALLIGVVWVQNWESISEVRGAKILGHGSASTLF